MLVPMRQLEVVGLRDRLDAALTVLQGLRAVEVADLADEGTVRSSGRPSRPPSATESQRSDGGHDDAELLATITQLLTRAPAPAPVDPAPCHDAAVDLDAIATLVPELRRNVEALESHAERLRGERETLVRATEPLRSLLPLVPELADLTDAELAEIALASVAVVLDDPEGRLVAPLRTELAALLGPRHLLVCGEPGPTGTRAALIVVRSDDVEAVEALLGGDRIRHQSLPAAYAGRSLRTALAAMDAHVEAVDVELAAALSAIAEQVAGLEDTLRAARAALLARLERRAAAARADVSERTFVLRLWTPAPAVPRVTAALQAGPAAPVVVTERRPGRHEQPPVVLRNVRPVRPYERLVEFLSWPRAGGLDPSGLMAFALPFLFGVMVGDVVYGLALVVVAAWLRRRLAPRSPVASDLARVLAAGGWWSVLFGVLFGEALGSLGNTLGMPALWFYRGGPEALTPLLGFALAVGATHIVLGLLLGIWTAARSRHLRHAVERGATLLVLVGLLAIAAVAVTALPSGLLTPSIAAIVVGLVLLGVALGPLGVLLAPLEALGAIGNVLSYLRLAAVGLASVYLANVANELAAQAPLVLGIVVAAFFHALNLALAAFSPMVQALRLHYVEFFSKFHDGGGRPFRPLGDGAPVVPLAASRPSSPLPSSPPEPSPPQPPPSQPPSPPPLVPDARRPAAPVRA